MVAKNKHGRQVMNAAAVGFTDKLHRLLYKQLLASAKLDHITDICQQIKDCVMDVKHWGALR